jgi:hypothetical protein
VKTALAICAALGVVAVVVVVKVFLAVLAIIAPAFLVGGLVFGLAWVRVGRWVERRKTTESEGV